VTPRNRQPGVDGSFDRHMLFRAAVRTLMRITERLCVRRHQVAQGHQDQPFSKLNVNEACLTTIADSATLRNSFAPVAVSHDVTRPALRMAVLGNGVGSGVRHCVRLSASSACGVSRQPDPLRGAPVIRLFRFDQTRVSLWLIATACERDSPCSSVHSADGNGFASNLGRT
jgi:hypothetical protein